MIRFIFTADTHLGFDYPFAKRAEKRQAGPYRGDDFFRNWHRIIDRAREEDIDFIVHSGDLFFRSKFPAELSRRVFEPLWELSDMGKQIYIVPGNHERSTIPHGIFSLYRNIHIFDSPRSFLYEKDGMRINLSGFPYVRSFEEKAFGDHYEETKPFADSDYNFLCIHQTIEGSRVKGYVFRKAKELVKTSEIPDGLSAVLVGHVHRQQIIDRDLKGRPLGCPIVYPGSIERTSFNEKDEDKGYFIVELDGKNTRFEFNLLQTRPMHELNIYSPYSAHKKIEEFIAGIPSNSVVKLRFRLSEREWKKLGKGLPDLPESMVISYRFGR